MQIKSKPMFSRIIIILCTVLCSVNADAKKLYKYQDEQGHWHFGDRAPSVDAKVEVMQLKAEHQQRVWLSQIKIDNGQGYWVRNDYPGPIEIEITFGQNQNARAEPHLPARFTIMPGNSAPLLRVYPLNRYRNTGYSLNYRYVLGSPDARHNASTLYLPPFAINDRFQVTQSFGGKISHQNAQNRYAVDIAMPEGTPVYAARGGVVMEVERDFYESGMKQSIITRANNVRILHDDGSIGVYAHLQLETAQVYPGLRVASGQLLAYSGNTGFSSGPHLHFAVQINRGMELQSVPFKFDAGHNSALEPAEGMWLSGGVIVK